MNLFKLSFRNVIGRPLSSILSVILLATGLSTAIVLELTDYQLTKNIESTGKDVKLVIGAKGSRIDLILSSVFQIGNPTGNINYGFYKLLKQNKTIKKMIPISMGDSYKRVRIVGTHKGYIHLYNGEIESGHIFSKPLEATVGYNVAKKLNLTIGGEFVGGHGMEDEVLHHHDNFKYKVVGVLKKNGTVLDNLILTPIETVWIMHAGHSEDSEYSIGHSEKRHHQEENHIHNNHEHNHKKSHDLHDHDNNSVDEILETINPKDKEVTAILFPNLKGGAKVSILNNANKQPGIMAVDPAPEIALLKSKLSPFVSIVVGIAYLITIIAMFSVFIGLLNSLSARKYEIALMRVMGASRLKVLSSILFEGVLLSLLGFVLSLILSHIGMEIVASWMEYEYQYEFSGWLFLTSEFNYLLIALSIGFISALYPAIRAYRTDIANTLSKG
ncbi:MAG: hypothetical protein CL846_07650 [Crocinitomicaceae bacterium]|nr:hypothetical protein [Crocinitomicaceae bacterium]